MQHPALQSLIHTHQLSHVWPYGSRVYGCHTAESDYDYIAIGQKSDQLILDDINITIYSPDEWAAQIVRHEISVLECCNVQPLLGDQQRYVLSLPALRESVSRKANNSIVRAKKKLIVTESFDYNLAIKSLFHAYRIYRFGTQLATTGRICDFAEANWLLAELRALPIQTWPELDGRYRLMLNEAASAFRVVAPKETGKP